MAWNEPNNPNRDPWSGPRRAGGPADLDEMLKRLKARFAGRRGPFSGGSLGIIVSLAIAAWLLTGFYLVDEKERAVVLRFGAVSRTVEPGPHWRLPRPFEIEKAVDVTRVRTAPEKSDLLTADESIVSVELSVQYRVTSPEQFLFNVVDPDKTLSQATKAVVRQVVGRNTMDALIADGRRSVAEQTRRLLQERLDAYRAGLTVIEVSLQDVRPPDAVQHAFDDAAKAAEEQRRLRDDAEAYAQDRLPKASGAAARELAEASSYRDRVIATAEGESSRFTQLLGQYHKAPKVTRQRMYLDAMAEVFSSTSKVLLDVDKSGPTIYLPLEQLFKGAQNAGNGDDLPSLGASPQRGGANPSDSRSRERGAH
jgi:membrane protease subunit HflK